MRPKDLDKLKAALPKKRKAQAVETVPKKARTIGVGQKDTLDEQAPEVVVEVILATSIQPPLLALNALPSLT